MAGVRIEFVFEDQAFRAALRRMTLAGPQRVRLLRAIGQGLKDTTVDRFDSGAAPDGARWAALSPGYLAVRRRPDLPILVQAGRRGGLQGSITWAVSGDSVIVGSNKIYAAVHQFGATIVPKSKKALVFRLAGGLVRARRVRIPARPYLGFGPADRQVVMDAVGVLLPRG